MSRIRCHSAFKHYEMFHGNKACCGGSSSGSTSIFVNCKGHGGFWSGVGMGLGAMLGNFAGGILSNLGFGGFGGFGMGGFGGFGGFGMGGFGMPGFGGFGFGNSGGGWGDWGNSIINNNNSKGVTDGDNILIENYKKEIEKLKDDASEELQKNLYDRIKAKMEKPQDSVYEKQNKLAYKELLDQLKAKFPDTDFGDDAEEEVNPETPAKNPTSAPVSTPANNETPANAPVETEKPVVETKKGEGTPVAENPKVEAGAEGPKTPATAPTLSEMIGNAKDLDTLLKALEGKDNLTDAEKEALNAKLAELLKNPDLATLSKLEPKQAIALSKYITQDQAINLLGKMNLLTKIDGDDAVKATSNLLALLLTEKSGLPLAAGHNTYLDDKDGADRYIHGKISNVKYDEETKTITFELKDKDGNYTMETVAKSGKYTLKEAKDNKTYTRTSEEAVYQIIENDEDDYAVRDGLAAMSTYN